MDNDKLLLGLMECLSIIREKLLSSEQAGELLHKLEGLLPVNLNTGFISDLNLIPYLLENQQDWEYVSANLNELERLYRSKHTGESATYQLLTQLSFEVKRYIQIYNIMRQQNNEIFDLKSKLNQNLELIDQVTSKFEKVEDHIQETRSNLKKTKRKIDSSYASFISILGIFSGIIMTFSGGLNLLGNSLSSLQNGVSIYRVIFLTAMFGFVMFNIIMTMMFVISRMNDKDIGVQCKCGDGCSHSSCRHYRENRVVHNFFCQSFNKYPYMIVFNAVLLYIMYAVAILWIYSGGDVTGPFARYEWLHHGAAELLLLALPAILFAVVFLLFRASLRRHSDASQQ